MNMNYYLQYIKMKKKFNVKNGSNIRLKILFVLGILTSSISTGRGAGSLRSGFSDTEGDIIFSSLSDPNDLAHEDMRTKGLRLLSYDRINLDTNIARIIGGMVVENADRYPYMASILNSRVDGNGSIRVWHVCGGTLIAPDVVLGAAHCSGVTSDFVQLGKKHVVSSNDVNDEDEVETFRITAQRVHPNWDRRYFLNDMVLYKLDSKSRKPTVRLTQQSRRDEDYMQGNKDYTILGWGKTDTKGNPSLFLREADVQYLSFEECTSSKYGYGEVINGDSMMCMKGDKKDACQGDSGGPLIQKSDDNPDSYIYDTQVGVISWGVDCAHERYPGIYAKLDYAWIERTVCNSVNGLSPESCINGKLNSGLTSQVSKSKSAKPLGSVCSNRGPEEWFRKSWDKVEWNCPKVSYWWWYACLYYSSQCPETCCPNNCDESSGMCDSKWNQFFS